MTEFDKELDNRDVFLGDRRCVICGIADPESLRHSYIIDRSVSGSVKKVRYMWSRTHVRDRLPSF